MTNKERQKSLDKKKWFVSKEFEADMSGYMPWCVYCDKSEYFQRDLPLQCCASQEERESKCLCATAYNRMKRREYEAKRP